MATKKDWWERKEEVEGKMLEIIEREGPKRAIELWRATLKEFNVLDKIYTKEIIPEDVLRDSVTSLLFDRRLNLLPDRKLGIGANKTTE